MESEEKRYYLLRLFKSIKANGARFAVLAYKAVSELDVVEARLNNERNLLRTPSLGNDTRGIDKDGGRKPEINHY